MFTIDLHGALASLLRLATGQPVHAAAQMQKAPRKAGREGANSAHPGDTQSQHIDIIEESLVAGGRNHLYLRSDGRQLHVRGAPDVEQAAAERGDFLSALFRTAA